MVDRPEAQPSSVLPPLPPSADDSFTQETRPTKEQLEATGATERYTGEVASSDTGAEETGDSFVQEIRPTKEQLVALSQRVTKEDIEGARRAGASPEDISRLESQLGKPTGSRYEGQIAPSPKVVAPESTSKSRPDELIRVGIQRSIPEFITKSDYDRLHSGLGKSHPIQLNTLRDYGIDAFNAAMQSSAEYQQGLAKQYAKDNVIIGDKSYPRDAWNALDQRYKSVARMSGLDEMQKLIDADVADFKAKHVIIGDKALTIDEWNGLDPKYQSIALRDPRGFDAVTEAQLADQSAVKAEIARQQATLSELKSIPGVYVPEEVMQPGVYGPPKPEGYYIATALQKGFDRSKLVSIFGEAVVKRSEDIASSKTAVPDTEAVVVGGKKWINIGTGEQYTDSERSALVLIRPSARDEMVRTPDSIRGSVFGSKAYQVLSGLPEKVLGFGEPSARTEPVDPEQRAFLESMDSVESYYRGLGFGAVAMFAGIPAFFIGMAFDPVGTGRDVAQGVWQATTLLGARTVSNLSGNRMTPVEAYRTGVNVSTVLITAIALKSGMSVIKGTGAKALKTTPVAYNWAQKAAFKAESLVSKSTREYGGKQLMLAPAKSGKFSSINRLASEKVAEVLRDAGADKATIAALDRLVDRVADSVARGDPVSIAKATDSLNRAVSEARIDPVIKEAVLDGGRYIQVNAAELAKTSDFLTDLSRKASDLYDTSVGTRGALTNKTVALWEKGTNTARAYRLTVSEINARLRGVKESNTWGDVKSQLSDISGAIDAAKENNPTLGDSLSDAFASRDIYGNKQPFREETRQPSWQQAAEDAVVLNRVQKLIDSMPSARRTYLYRELQKTGEARKLALKELWEYFEELYGKEALEQYLKTGEWGDGGVPEGLGGTIRGTEQSAKIVEEIKKASNIEKELNDALTEIKKILDDNRDIPPDAPIVREPTPERGAPTERGGTQTAVREKTEVKPKTETKPRTETKPKTSEEIEEMVQGVKPKPDVRPFSLPGVEEKPAVREAPAEQPLADAIGQSLSGAGLQVMRQGVPIPIVSPTASPAPSITPVPSPSDTPSPIPEPSPSMAPVPSPAPNTIPSPVSSLAPSAAPVPSPAPYPAPIPIPIPAPVPSLALTPVSSPAPSLAYSTMPSPVSVPPPTPIPTTVSIVKPPVVPGIGGVGGEERQRIPSGSIAWKRGYAWKFVPPPWNQRKPITLPRGVVPLGAVNLGGRTAAETVQMIGESKSKVPRRISIDEGVVDVFVGDNGRTIRFTGKGEDTDVSGIISNTQGMLVEDGSADITTDYIEPKPNAMLKSGSRYNRSEEAMADMIDSDGRLVAIPTPVPSPILNPVERPVSSSEDQYVVPAEEQYDEMEEEEVDEDEDTGSPAPRPVNEADDDFSDVTSLSSEDEEELFGLGEGGDDPTSSDDDLSDILDLSEKDNEELFGLGGKSHTNRYKNTRSGRRALRRRTSPPSSLGNVGY